jgi:uracil-DNA glycosylase
VATVAIEESWKIALQEEFEKEYFQNIIAFLKKEKAERKIIYPAGPHIFNAFAKTPFEKVKVVILGQDPYHGPNQAHGLSFSVLPPTPAPPSLQNIYKELATDLGLPIPMHGNLEAWATQGVLLLNASLTVRANEPMSHSKIGWEQFTNAVITKLSTERKGIVFVLWGKFAQQKSVLIDSSQHFILQAAHPSPLSAFNGFFGCKHFSKINTFLQSKGQEPIDWQV